jgi:hypothetical protein
MDRLDNTPRQHAKSDGARATSNLWRTKAQICDDLDISPRTLNRRVQAGGIERRQVGNKALYRAGNSAPLRQYATPLAPQSGGGLAIAGVHAVERAPSADPSPDLATLTDLVRDLSNDLADAAREKGEAVGVGWALLEQRDAVAAERDRLASDLADLQRAVYQLTDSPLAFPLRRRILQTLKRSLH